MVRLDFKGEGFAVGVLDVDLHAVLALSSVQMEC